MTLPNNTLLQGGKYRIVRFISSGGFGCTYEAEHVMLGKRVAIKEFFVKDFCNRDETTSHVTVGTQTKVALVSKLKRKFIEEASALSRFNHPNIVHVSDVFEENGTAYYVMDFIDGKSINEILKTQSSIPESKAVKYILQVAEALKQVHAQNRLHLDIKPGNIMIDSNDNAVLIDFGASKQYDEEAGENTSTLVGRTPGYAPLEQLGNDIVKFFPATDIYALGATLYKMLSGKTPLNATLLASGEVLEPLPEDITDKTRNAIEKAMVINKRERYQDIEDFICGLGQSNVVESTDEISHNEEDTDFDDSIGNTDNLDDEIQVNSTDEDDSIDYDISDEDDKGKKKLIVPLIFVLLIVFGVIIYLFASTSSPEDLFEKGKEAFEQNDYETAFDYYLQAANKGDGRAQNNVGQMYLSGQGVEQNYEEAYNWLKKAADQDLSKGKVNLGLMYINGLVGAEQDSIVAEEDINMAFDLFKSAADQNDPDGQYFVGRMCEDGLAPFVVSADDSEAIEYYRLAAQQNQIYAQVAYDRLTTKSDGTISASFINNKLLGNHLFSLQWISWDRFGNVTITKTNKKDEFHIEGVQEGKLCADEEEGKNNEDYLYINGIIKVINEKKLKFFGTISTKVYHLNNGEVCSRYGSFTFEATGNRKYWRLQEMDNPCEEVTDYVDIYF